jgi:hypothetical protein
MRDLADFSAELLHPILALAFASRPPHSRFDNDPMAFWIHAASAAYFWLIIDGTTRSCLMFIPPGRLMVAIKAIGVSGSSFKR